MTREEQIAQLGLANVYPAMTPEEIALGEANKGAAYPASWVNSSPYTPNEFYDPAYPLGYKPGSVPPWYIQVGNHWENPPGQELVGKLGNQFFVTDPRGGGLYSYGMMPNKDTWNYETQRWEPNPAFAPYLGMVHSTARAQTPVQTPPVQQTPSVNNAITQASNQLWNPPAAVTQPQNVGGVSKAIDSLLKARGNSMDLWDFPRANRPTAAPTGQFPSYNWSG